MTSFSRYSVTMLQQKAKQLILHGMISRQQPIYALCKYIPVREWDQIERELEESDYLLRDRIGDLIGHEEWHND